MTFSDIRTAVFELLGEVEGSPHCYTKAEIDRYINDAYRHLARETQAVEHQLFIDTVAGRAEYVLPEYISEVKRVTYDNTRIQPTTVHELNRYDTTWRDRTGTPFAYRIDQLNDTIGLYPAPGASSGTAMETDLGTVVDFGTDDSFADTDEDSGTDLEDLGVVADVDQSGKTHLFVDEEGDPFDQYSPSAEVGLIVRIPDHAFLADDGRDIDTFQYDTEFGITTDIYASSTSSVTDYAVSPETGMVVQFSGGATAAFNGEYGILVEMSGRTPAEENKDTGITVQIAGGSDDYAFSGEYGIPVQLIQGEYGIIIDYNDSVNNVEVWGIKDPDDMTQEDDKPELPRWSHQAVVFAAASRALTKESEAKNIPASEAYAEMAGIYTDHLKRVVHDRTPNKIKHMGSVSRRKATRGRPRLGGEYPDVWSR